MPNIVTTEGLTVYNVTEVGSSSSTGAESTFLITPLEGYYIAASQFSLSEEFNLADYPEITSITFSDTSSAYTIDNNVLVTITWNGTSAINSNYDISLNISFDDVANVYDSNTTALSFNLVQDSFDGLFDNQSITYQAVQDDSVPQAINLSSFGSESIDNLFVTCDINQNGQVAIFDIVISVDEEGQHFLQTYEQGDALLFSQTELSEGTFEMQKISSTNDLFGNVYTETYRLYYTRASVETDTATLFLNSQLPNEYAIANVGGNQVIVSGVGSGDAIDGADTLTNETSKVFALKNISSENVTFSYADNWANDGEEIPFLLGAPQDGVSTYQYHFDVNANVSGDRQMNVEVKDSFYNITRTTFIIKQTEGVFVELKLVTTQDQEFDIYSGNILQDENLADFGKVISHPSELENAFAQTNSNPPSPMPHYVAPFFSEPLYKLMLFVDGSVSIEDIPGLVTVDQQGYPLDAFPQDGWINFIDNWNIVGDNIYEAFFFVRNQDVYNYLGNPVTTQDRTATFSVTHPIDPTKTDTLTITQDARYDETVDTAVLKIAPIIDGQADYSTASTADVVDQAVSVSEFGQLTQHRLFIKLNDFENDFNMPNTVTDTSQYPLPRVTIETSGIWTSFDNGAFYNVSVNGINNDNYLVSDFWNIPGESITLIPNENYDAADSDNDYQYYLDYQLSNNNSFSTRFIKFFIFHPQNPNIPNVYNNDFIQHGQLANNIARFKVTSAIGSVYNFNPEGESIGVGGLYNGDLPTIGLWNADEQQFTAIDIDPIDNNFVDGDFSIQIGNNVDTFPSSVGSFAGASNINLFITKWEANTPEGPRSKTLGIWHSSLTPGVDLPSDTITLSQAAAQENPDIHYVEVFTDFSTNLSYEAGSVTVYIKVGDHSVADIGQGTNFPDVEIYRWNGPAVSNGIYSDENGNYSNEGIVPNSNNITVQVNNTPNVAEPNTNTFYTHSVQINHSELTSSNQYFFAVRAKHQYQQSFDENDYVVFTIQPQASLTITTAYTDVNLVDGLYELDGVKTVIISSDATSLSFEVEHANLEPYTDDLILYPEPTYSLVTARFLNANNLGVFNETAGDEYDGVSQDAVPLGFADNNNTPYLFHDGVNETVPSTYSPNIPNTEDGLLASTYLTANAFPQAGFGIKLNVSPQFSGQTLNYFIGVWRSEKTPRTNLINTNYEFDLFSANDFQTNNFNGTIGSNTSFHISIPGNNDPTNADIISYVLNNSIYEPIESTAGSGVYDGFNWNFGGVGETNLFSDNNETAHIKLLVLKPEISNGQISVDADFIPPGYGVGKTLGISFEVQNFNTYGDAQSFNSVISNGGVFYSEISAVSNEPNILQSVQEAITLNGNGKYEARIKQNSAHIVFSVRTNAQFTIKNIVVWEIEDDISIRPGESDFDFNQPPDDILKVLHQSSSSVLSFSATGYAGGPIPSYIATTSYTNGTQLVIDANPQQANINPNGANLQFELDNGGGANPVLKAWDGVNNTDIEDIPWLSDFAEIVGGPQVGTVAITFYVNANFGESSRQVTIGLFNGEPSSSTQAPLDTYTLIQDGPADIVP